MSTHKHPLDFDLLEKGSWIETPELESATLTKCGEGAWGLKLVGLCQRIEQETGILCRVDHDRIRLMDDLEASEHAYRRKLHHYRGVGRQSRRLLKVDTSGFDDEQKAIHAFRVRAALAVTSASRAALRKEKRRKLLGGGEE